MKTVWFEYEYRCKPTSAWKRERFALVPSTKRQASAALRYKISSWNPETEARIVRIELKEEFGEPIKGEK